MCFSAEGENCQQPQIGRGGSNGNALLLLHFGKVKALWSCKICNSKTVNCALKCYENMLHSWVWEWDILFTADLIRSVLFPVCGCKPQNNNLNFKKWRREEEHTAIVLLLLMFCNSTGQAIAKPLPTGNFFSPTHHIPEVWPMPTLLGAVKLTGF